MSELALQQTRDVYVGVDTSNYTTSLSLCDGAGQVLANLKMPLAVRQGERGLRQSDAVFAHVRNLPVLMGQLQALLHPAEGEALTPRGIGYSATPRTCQGSYMPCFLAGEVAASTLQAAWNVPVCSFSHQQGHIMAALYSAGAMHLLDAEKTEPFVAFHVSGGTTDVLLVRPSDATFTVEELGSSLDLHAGQAIDRIGVRLGLSFPCGPALEALAATCTAKIPKPRICVKGLCCHLSGLENLAVGVYESSKDAALTAAYTLEFIGETLLALCKQVRRQYPGIPMVFSGGVMSNRILQKKISKVYDAYFSEPAFSADNGAGIALLCRRQLNK